MQPDRGASRKKRSSNYQYLKLDMDAIPYTSQEPELKKKDTLLEDINKLAESLVAVYESEHKSNPNKSEEAMKLLLEEILMMVEPKTTTDTLDDDRQNHLTPLESNDEKKMYHKIIDDVDLSILKNFNELVLRDKNISAEIKVLDPNLNLEDDMIKPTVLEETKRAAKKFWGKKGGEQSTEETSTIWKPIGVKMSRKFMKKNETHTHHRRPPRPVNTDINMERVKVKTNVMKIKSSEVQKMHTAPIFDLNEVQKLLGEIEKIQIHQQELQKNFNTTSIYTTLPVPTGGKPTWGRYMWNENKTKILYITHDDPRFKMEMNKMDENRMEELISSKENLSSIIKKPDVNSSIMFNTKSTNLSLNNKTDGHLLQNTTTPYQCFDCRFCNFITEGAQKCVTTSGCLTIVYGIVFKDGINDDQLPEDAIDRACLGNSFGDVLLRDCLEDQKNGKNIRCFKCSKNFCNSANESEYIMAYGKTINTDSENSYSLGESGCLVSFGFLNLYFLSFCALSFIYG